LLNVVTQLRGLIGELRPAGLEEFGLATALEGYVARLQREGGPDMPDIHLELPEHDMQLPKSVALCLFRVAQEALRNALKHANARHISLYLCSSMSEVMLRVSDDGCGFQVPVSLGQLAHADHFGLVGMAERVEWIGGELTIRSQPSAGTDVTVRVPLHVREGDVGRND